MSITLRLIYDNLECFLPRVVSKAKISGVATSHGMIVAASTELPEKKNTLQQIEVCDRACKVTEQ
jgi:hypothetical protein